MRHRSRDQRGAVAVLFAILAVVLFGIGAMAIDLGHAYAKKRDLQTSVDLAVLAAANRLPASTPAEQADVINAAEDYLEKNFVNGQDTRVNWDLVSSDISDGYLQFISDTDIRLTAPRTHISYSLARVFKVLDPSFGDGLDVNTVARVRIGSIGAPAPFFMPMDCSWGQQVIKAAAQAPEPPPIFPSTDTDGSGGNIPDPGVADPYEVEMEDPPVPPATQISIEGKKFGSLPLEVSFTRDDKTYYSNALTVASFGPNDELTVEVPDAVLKVEGVWYIRVKNGYGWSKESQAITFVVKSPADATPGCGVKVEGDFGLVDSPRNDTTQLAEALERNLKLGLDHPISVWPNSSPPTGDKACMPTSSPVANAVLDTDPPNPSGTPNCLNILTGNKVDMVTDGLVTDSDARLRQPTTPGCNRNGGDSQQSLLGVDINADVLSCFLEPGVRVGDVSKSTGATPDAIDPAIFESPRFMWVPVINNPINPSNGFYPIVEFRGVFITDETSGSMKGSSTATSVNGVNNNGTKVTAVSVVAINPDSLPKSAPNYNGPIGPYMGFGPKIARLVE